LKRIWWLGAALFVAVPMLAMGQQRIADAGAMEAEVHRTGSVVLDGIQFEAGQAMLQAGSETILAEIVKLMRDRTDWRFEIQGHTDNIGAKPANVMVSGQRAKSVLDWLTKHGIDESRLVARGYGDAAPLADNTTEDGRARNRRIVLKKLHEE